MTIRLRAASGERTMLLEDFEERVRHGQVTPDVPVFSPTEASFVPAGSLRSYRDVLDADATRLARALNRRALPLLTAVLVGIQFNLFFWGLIPGFRRPLVMAFVNWGPLSLEGRQTWRLVAHALVHGSLSHILVNTVFLAWAAWNLERALGRLNLVVLFLVGVAWSGAASVLISPEQPIMGSSAGSFTLLAACVVLGWRYRDLLHGSARRHLGSAALPFLAVPLALGLSSWETHTWGHLVGIAVGGLLGSLMEPPVPCQAGWRRTAVPAAACLLTLLLLVVMSLLGPSIASSLT
jgi:membrane associated rhomboid family serine protease